MEPDADPEAADLRGGALLIHGLTDSPYSMRALAARLNARGYYTLSLRMQGHGTVPGGLVTPTWEDWAAAVRMGARHVRKVVGADRPLVLVGYSNGGALVTKYALDALEDATLPAPATLILVSPMIGVSPAARLARFISMLGPVVDKARWIDVVPEYNPFKYNSFPANAGTQTFRLTHALGSQLTRAQRDGLLQRMPPVLAFQSVVDTTVSTPAVAYDLLDHLPAGRNELVLFDLNRHAGVDAFTRPEAVLPRLIGGGARPYTVTLVTNANPDTAELSAMSVAAGATALTAEPLGLSWPDQMYSLSHIALPFPGGRPVVWRTWHGPRVRQPLTRPAEPARREGRTDHPGRGADARVVEPVLPLPGTPRGPLDRVLSARACARSSSARAAKSASAKRSVRRRDTVRNCISPSISSAAGRPGRRLVRPRRPFAAGDSACCPHPGRPSETAAPPGSVRRLPAS